VIDIGTGNEQALAGAAPKPLAEIVSRPSWLRFSDSQTTGESINPTSEDIGRVVNLNVGSETRTYRVHHVGDGLRWRRWTGEPSLNVTGDGYTPLTSFASQSVGLWADVLPAAWHLDPPTWNLYATHCEDANTLTIQKKTGDGLFDTVHNGPITLPWSALPAPVAVGFAVPSAQVIYAIYVTAREARIWRGTFAAAPLSGAVTWAELPYRVLASHNDDRFRSAPGDGEAFDWRVANGFDAMSFNGGEVVLCQDHAQGRSRTITRSSGGVWSDPVEVIPLDLVSATSHTLFCRMTVDGERLLLTGGVARPDSEFGGEVLLRSRDGRVWSWERDGLVHGSARYGQVVKDALSGRHHHVSRAGVRSSPALAETVIAPYSISLNRGAESMPTAEVDIPATGPAPSGDDEVTVRLGYNSRANLINVGTFGLDTVPLESGAGTARRKLTMRHLDGKKLSDWKALNTHELWGQSIVRAEMLESSEYEVVQGEPREPQTVLVLQNQWFDGAVWQPNPELVTNLLLRVWTEASGEASDPVLIAGEELHLWLNGVMAVSLRVEEFIGQDGIGHVYDTRVVSHPGSYSLPNNSEMVTDVVWLGGLKRRDELMLATERRYVEQLTLWEVRCSAYSWPHGEIVSLHFHRADGRNTYYLRLGKVENQTDADLTDLAWAFGSIAEGVATGHGSGTLLTNIPAFQRVYVRTLYQNGRVWAWASANPEEFGAPLIDGYVESSGHPAREGSAGAVGLLEPVSIAITTELGAQSGATAPYNRLFLDEPATAWPMLGAVEIQGTVTDYHNRDTQPKMPATSNFHDIPNKTLPYDQQAEPGLTDHDWIDGFQGVHRYHPGGNGPGPWVYMAALPFNPAGMASRLRWRDHNSTVPDQNLVGHWGENFGYCIAYETGTWTLPASFEPGHPYYEAAHEFAGARAQFSNMPDVPNNTPTVQPMTIGWLMGYRFYPTFHMSGGEWPAIASPGTVTLAPREGELVGTAIERVVVTDIESSIALAEGVQQVGALAGVEIVTDKVPATVWGLTDGDGWAITYPDGQMPRLAYVGAGGTKMSTFGMVDGVFRARLWLGQVGLVLQTGGGGTVIRLAAGAVEFRDLTGDALRASFPYRQGAGANQQVTVRVSINGALLSVWIDDAFMASYEDIVLAGAQKVLGFAAYQDTTIHWVAVAEAHERLQAFVVEEGQTAAGAIGEITGNRRLKLLYRGTRPIRFGTLEQREQAGAPLVEVVSDSATVDNVPIVTVMKVVGDGVSAERTRDVATHGTRFEKIENTSLTTVAACEQEALVALRLSHEQGLSGGATLSPADLRIENGDVVELGGQWIVDSSDVSYQSAGGGLTMRLNLRGAVE
jgi:hypothetical protein